MVEVVVVVAVVLKIGVVVATTIKTIKPTNTNIHTLN